MYGTHTYISNIYPTVGHETSTTSSFRLPRQEGDPIDLGDGEEHGGREPQESLHHGPGMKYLGLMEIYGWLVVSIPLKHISQLG